MEANICDINHLDADVLLPPRKRLLAGFKKQASDGNGALNPVVLASSTSSSTSSSSEFDTHLNTLLTSRLNNPTHTSKELVEASRSAAIAAVQAAQAARAAADEKAAIAAKAVIAARSALDLVASFSDQERVSKERYMKKNKLKKHVPVQLLYTKHQPIENHGTDEELARRLHRAINSSPRISRHSPTSEVKGHKHKKPKSSPHYEKARVSDVGLVLEGSPGSISNEHAVAGEVDSESPSQEARAIKADDKASKYEKDNQLELDNGEAESSHSKEKTWEDTNSPGRRRGRVKLKKLPLSICTFRDQANPKEDIVGKSSLLTQENKGNPTATSMPLFSLQPSTDSGLPIEATPTWKCQEFKAPACVKQNKVMQS